MLPGKLSGSHQRACVTTMKCFRENDASPDDSPTARRIEPSLGPLPEPDEVRDQAASPEAPAPRRQVTQSGVPVLPGRTPPVGQNAWARFWAQRDHAQEPSSLSASTNHRNLSAAGSSTDTITQARPWSTAASPSGFALSLKVIAACLALAAVWFAATMVYYTFKYPDPMLIHGAKPPTLRILSRGGSLLAERDGKHLYIPVGLLPAHVVNAVVAIEDRRFYGHNGIDLSGLARAALANLRAGRYAQGGSTLTQQLAKNMYLSSDRTMLRKLDELTLAVWLELRLDKREILELYLNQVYFGGGAYGIEAAAQRHFGKSARALSVVEAAIVAGLLKAPSRYSPSTSPAAARRRGRVVLQAMHEAGFLSESELAAALAEPVRFAKDNTERANDGSEYAADLILERMPELIVAGTDTIIVETTIDTDLQKLAQHRLTQTLVSEGGKLKASQGAVVVVDSYGGIRAIVGGVDHAKSQFNRATKAERQPGSTFKPFVYLSALENGMSPETMVNDRPLNISGWSPRNANGRYRGEVSLRDALAASINTVAVRLALEVGPAAVAATARRAGISSPLREEASLALGTSEVNLLDLTSAYALFANGGRRIEPYVIRRITTSSGRILYANASENSSTVADLRHIGAMNDMLNEALVAGTGRKATLATHPAAGKTGTSQDFRDAWFVGYTAHLTAGVWLGNDNGEPMDRVVGGSLPAAIWHAMMSEAHKSLAPLPLPGTYRPALRTPSVEIGEADFARKTAKTRTSLAPLTAPPLPARFKDARPLALARDLSQPKAIQPRVEVAQQPDAHPAESISTDFIAQAIERVPAATRTSPAKQVAGATTGADAPGFDVPGFDVPGFDVNEIRKRLEQSPAAPPANAGRGPYMALGAGSAQR